MKFKAKCLAISTGTVPVIVLNRKTCQEMDLHLNERVRVVNTKNKKEIIAAVDFYEDKLSNNTALLMLEVSKALGINKSSNTVIELSRAENPPSISFIKQKLNGSELDNTKIKTIITDIVNGALTDIEITYFVSSCYTHGLSAKEIVSLTRSIVDTGEKLDLRTNPKEKIYDKHCVGGVAGNRTTMLVIPIVAAYGLKIPKTSSRAITSPAGTADTMEVLTNVCLDTKKLSEVVNKTNACMVWGGSLNLAPADDKIIKVEHPLSIDTDGLMLSSILAKKLSVGSTDVLIDIPYGEHSKIKTKSRAKTLRDLFIKIGKELGMNIKVIITDGSSPIGNGVGPLLEAIDVLKVLRNDSDAPKDLVEKTIFMASELINMQVNNTSKSREIVKELLSSGKAYQKFMEIIDAQGRKKLPELAKYNYVLLSDKTGKIKSINNTEISNLARICGAPKTKESGIYMHKKVNEQIRVGEPILTLYANNEESLKMAKDYYSTAKVYEIK